MELVRLIEDCLFVISHRVIYYSPAGSSLCGMAKNKPPLELMPCLASHQTMDTSLGMTPPSEWPATC